MKKYLFILLVALGGLSNTLMADTWNFQDPKNFTVTKVEEGVYHFRILTTKCLPGYDYHVIGLGGECHRWDNEPWGMGAIVVEASGHSTDTVVEVISALHEQRWEGSKENSGRARVTPRKGSVKLYNATMDAFNLPGFFPIKQNAANNEAAWFSEFDWYVPTSMQGYKDVKIRINIKTRKHLYTVDPMGTQFYYFCDGVIKDHDYSYELISGETFPNDFKPQPASMQQPLIAIDMGDGVAHPGDMLVMVTGTMHNIYSYRWNDDKNFTKLSTPELTTMVYVPINDTVRKQQRMTCQMVYNGGIQQLRNNDFGGMTPQEYYNLYTAEVSNKIDIPAYHRIYDFRAALREDTTTHMRDGAVELTWKIAYPREKDICEMDLFEIQRDTLPDFSTAETIGAVNYNAKPKDSEIKNDTLVYSFVDETPEVKKGKGTPNWKYYYRIRRGSASVWEWDKAGSVRDQLYASGLARVDSIKSAPGNRVLMMGFTPDQSITLNPAADYATSRVVNLDFTFTQTAESGHSLYYYDQSPIYLVKKMISYLHNDTVVEDIVIPQDSIRFIPSSDPSKRTWTIHCEEKANTPCVYYEYALRIDTTESLTRCRFAGDDSLRRVFEKPLTLRLPDHGFYSGGMTLDVANSWASTTNPSNVYLQWQTLGGSFDYYTIRRKAVGEDHWTTLETELPDMSYDDHRSPVGKDCEYRIIGTEICDGVVQDSITLTGRRYEYGSISGHVSMPNGLAYSGVRIVLQCDTLGVYDTTYTDISGRYHFDHLYYEESGIIYTVMPTSANPYDDFGDPYAVDLSGYSAEPTNINFVNKNAVSFSGRVLYEHSTVPVHHCQFLVNGQLARGTNGQPIESDASGNFELMVPAGSTTIRGTMEGHTFLNNGYFLIEGDSVLPLTDRIDGARLYDRTKVTVIGHVAGGTIQGSKAWGDVMAANNLGDNLTLVFELEGDNISHLMNYDDERTEEDTTYVHPLRGKTRTEMTKKRIVVHPDSTTGEYRVDLFPVRWKLVQATAEGYATLLPAGQTSVALNLSDCVWPIDTIRQGGKRLPYHRLNNIVYRAPISLTYQQLYYGMKVDYLGEPQMAAQSMLETNTIPTLLRDTAGNLTGYLLGKPLFQAGKKYTYIIHAHEDYYYNNQPTSPQHDQVILTDHDVRVINGMNASNDIQTIHLHDVTGEGRVTLLVNNPTFTQRGELALRQIEMESEIDGLYVHAEPIRGYIAAAQQKQGTDAIVAEAKMPSLDDVICDPYGSSSSAYVETGTKYTAHQRNNVIVTGGVTIGVTSGSSSTMQEGMVTAPAGMGAYIGSVTSMDHSNGFNIPIVTGAHMDWNHDYSYSLANRVSTSSDAKMVGAKADVYIGHEWRYYVARTEVVMLIDSAMYRMKQPAFKSGQMLLIAEPVIDSMPYYLVRGEGLGIGSAPDEATFTYTQDHILRVVIPTLERRRNDLILTNATDAEAHRIANENHKATYVSTVPVDDPNFGYSYVLYGDTTSTEEADNTDYVYQYNLQIAQWQTFIANNEKRKLTAAQKGKLLADYSISYGANRTFSESASHAAYESGPVFDGVKLGWDHSKYTPYNGDGKGQQSLQLFDAVNKEQKDTTIAFWLKGFGWQNKVTIDPMVNLNVNRDVNTTDSDCKSAGFTLSTGSEGYEDIAVYRLTDNSFNDEAEDDREKSDGFSTGNAKNYLYADYVFIRKGGATRCPYEAEEKTLFYKPGTLLAPATVKIDDPQLELSTRMIDNVPSDQDATIVLTLSNKSTYDPNAITVSEFVLSVDEATNPDGLQLFMDGTPLGNGRSFYIAPGASIQKTLVIRRGRAYNYENISLRLLHGCQAGNRSESTFSVHYAPVSTPVSLSLPVQNWLMNTLSPSDKNGYYIPVEITGFDTRTYDNFDHIELQYKLSVESDDRWVTLCSYYADSTYYRLASGEKQMIDGTTIRNIHFYGERDPMEQNYDLRAVSYCRLGTSFVTRSSEIKHGIKDTRVPRLFGTATPANGILRVGDYISIPFSEDIAANYLDEDNNFQITGYTNSSALTSSTSLYMDAATGTYAATELSRNLTEKDITFDLMVLPTDLSRSMSYMMHGTRENLIALGQRAVGKDAQGHPRICLDLEMDLGSNIYHAVSDTLPYQTNWMRVAAVYHSATGKVEFYCGTEQLETMPMRDRLPPHYSSTGHIYLGNNPDLDDMDGYRFAGNMLEVRLWNRALGQSDIVATNMTHLNGSERGLLAYYRLNEGRNTYAEDLAFGARMYLHGTEWVTPDGKSIHLKGDMLLLDGRFFHSSDLKDYTLTMWFRTDKEHVPGEGTTLFRSGQFDITLFPKRIRLHCDQQNIFGEGEYMDNRWHQVALSVNRALGTSALYMDGVSVAQFNSSLIGAPCAAQVEIGPMEGSVDELTFWETALPDNYLTSFFGHTPNNEELALVTHVGFTQRKENSSGIYETVYSPYNARVHRNSKQEIIPVSEDDRVVLTADEEAKRWLTDGNAPVNEKGSITKMGFNWIGRANELVINLTMLDKEINKQNIFVTVRDVEDLHGNPMPSPLTWILYVDRNQLRWSEPYIVENVPQGEERVINVDLINEGGITTNYAINGLPSWLSIDTEQGALSPLEHRPVHLTISDQLSPGEYDEIIYLSDDRGLNEPLNIRVVVEALQPTWQVDTSNTNMEAMGIFGQVVIRGARGKYYYATDRRDIVAVFNGSTCVGVQHIQMIGLESMVVMNIYGLENTPHQPLQVLYWEAATGRIFSLRPANGQLYYTANTVLGSPDDPIQLISTELMMQQIELQKGWNWISFYIDPLRNGDNFSASLDGQFEFTSGDLIGCADRYMDYSKQPGQPGTWYAQPIQFYADSVYYLHVAHGGQMGVRGYQLADQDRQVWLHQGWNDLPYMLSTAQDLTTALAGYSDDVQPGDIVKSYNTFAMYSRSQRAWIGSLTHLLPGQGYMLYRQGQETVRMRYQSSEIYYTPMLQHDVATAPARYRSNLPMILRVEGARTGDRLQALVSNETLVEATADTEGRFWMLLNAPEQADIRFCLVSAQGVDTLAETIVYHSSLPAVGTSDRPYLLHRAEAVETSLPVLLSIYDVVGNCLWTAGETPVIIDADTDIPAMLSGYPTGVYIALIREDNEIKPIKWINE